MFGTLHYNANSNETQFVQRSVGGSGDGGYALAYFACENCRTKKLKCDGQKDGCFRCKASSTPCSYARYCTRKETRRRSDTHQRTRNGKVAADPDQTSPTQQSLRDRGGHQGGALGGVDESLETMGDEQSGRYEDTPREDVSSPELDPRFGTGNEQSLFDRFLSENVLQDQDGSALDFSYTNFDESIDSRMPLQERSVNDLVPSQLLSPDLTTNSPELHTSGASASLASTSSPRRQLEDDGPNTSLASTSAGTFEYSAAGSPPHDDLGPFCNCPQAMSIHLEDAGSRFRRVSIQNTHHTLAHIKTVLQHCAQIHSCAHCSPRSDHMMLAAVVVNKNVSLLQEVWEVYTQRCTASSKAGDGEDAGEQPSLHHANAHHQPLQGRNSRYHLFVGDYVVNSEDEWAAVIKPLIEILSRRTLDLLERMKGAARAKRRETQVQMLMGAEHKARKVAWGIRDGKGPLC